MFKTPHQTPGEQYALATVLPLVATFFVGLRFLARHLRKNSLLWDDWLVVVALVFTYVTGVFMIIGTALGAQGRHMKFTPEGAPVLDKRYRWFLKMLYAGQLSQMLAIGPTKISMLLLYRRIFRGRVFNIITWTLIMLVVGWIVAFFFSNMLECIPIHEAWRNAPGLGTNPHCVDAVPMYLAQVYSDVVLDALILVVPIPLVWKLQLPTKQKVAVCGIFLLGIITIASSCAKMIIFNFVGRELAQQPDISYFLTPIVYWPLIEASLQIIAACLPMLRSLFKDISKGSMLSSLRTKRLGYVKSYDGDRRQFKTSQSGLYPELSSSGDDTIGQNTEIEHLPLSALEPTMDARAKGIMVERTFDVKV